MRALSAAPKVEVSGTVLDGEGRPVGGIEVEGLPRGKDYPWCAPAATDARGRFTLRLAAPAEYSFLIRRRGVTVLTPEKNDPGYVDISTQPGREIRGLVLRYEAAAFEN
jgi:hypothetical protein